MKKSEVVVLTLVVGVFVASYIERRPNTVRNYYNSREDCVQDYSDNQCRDGSSSGYGGYGRWYGPDYREDEPRRGNHAAGRETVRRGGFGFSGRGVGS